MVGDTPTPSSRLPSTAVVHGNHKSSHPIAGSPYLQGSACRAGTDHLAITIIFERVGQHLLAAARPTIDQHRNGLPPL